MDPQINPSTPHKLPTPIIIICTISLVAILVTAGILIRKNAKDPARMRGQNFNPMPVQVYNNPTATYDYQVSNTVNQNPSSDNDMVAESVETISENVRFKIQNYPDADFALKRIAIAKGGVQTQFCRCYSGYCDDTARYISVKLNSAQQNCIGSNNTDSEYVPAVLFISLKVSNNSGVGVGGTFIQVVYDTTVNGKKVIRKAIMNPPWSAINVDAFSDRTLPMGFVIPEDVEEVRIIYGNYADMYGNAYSSNSFEKTEGGFIVNLKNKTITNLPG